MGNPVQDFPWTYRHVAATMVPPIKTGPGVLHSVVINSITTIGFCTLYDGVDNGGTVIGVLGLTTAVQVSCQPVPLLYDCECLIGIHIEFDQNLVADLTVNFK